MAINEPIWSYGESKLFNSVGLITDPDSAWVYGENRLLHEAPIEFIKALSDTINLSDNIIKSMGIIKSDTINLSDNIIKSIETLQSDIINLSDSLIAKDFGLSKSDIINLSDSLINQVSFKRTLTDIITMMDSSDISILEVIREVLNLTSSLAKNIALESSLSRDVDLESSLAKNIALESLLNLGESD